MNNMSNNNFIFTIDNIEDSNDILSEDNFIKYILRINHDIINHDRMDIDNNNSNTTLEDDIKNYYNNKVKIYIDHNVHYNINTKKLHLYDGLITNTVVKHKYMDSYQISQTLSGSIYVTIPPTHFYN